MNPIRDMLGSLFYSYRRTKTPKDEGSGVTTEYTYFLDRTGLKSAAISDQVFTWSKLSDSSSLF